MIEHTFWDNKTVTPMLPPAKVENPQVVLTKEQQDHINKLSEASRDKWPDITDSKDAVRYNKGKTRWDLIDFETLKPIADVLEYGANTKYKAWNFQEGKGLSVTQTIRSLLSHTFAYLRGEELDKESGLPHLGHIGCNLFFLLYFKHYGYKDNDDRFKR